MEQVVAIKDARSDRLGYGVLVALYLLAGTIALGNYIPWTSVNFVLGGLVFLFIVQSKQQSSPSLRLLLPALVLIVVALIMPGSVTLFAALSVSLLCTVEYRWGRLRFVAFIVLLCMTPSLQYLVGVFSFPIRMWLTGIAGQLLSLTHVPTKVAGNVITFGTLDHTVDPACMGLKMLLTSLLCGLFLLLFMQKQQGKTLNNWWLLVSMVALFELNLVSNIIRILILVYFNIRSLATMHGITGLVTLILYVLLPAYWLTWLAVKKWGRPTSTSSIYPRPINPKRSWHLLCGLFVLCMVPCLSFRLAPIARPTQLLPVDGYASSRYNKDILQYKNSNSLVYIKKIDGFLSADHNPVTCWIASGYEFESMSTILIDNSDVYIGILKKGNNRLFTAWWYDNGTYATISQADWRWRVMKGQGEFAVVNVTAAEQAALVDEVTKIKKERVFTGAIKGRN